MTPRPVDELVGKCSLKHEIRINLWAEYVTKIIPASDTIKRYLTLYSPPMMDIKYFYKKGLIKQEEDFFKGVTAVTYDGKAYTQAISEVPVRPEVMIQGNINKLLSAQMKNTFEHKKLLNLFPYQVINLDYTGTLFSASNEMEVSEHLLAIDQILDYQKIKKANKFVLFITTRVDQHALFNQSFIQNLQERVDENVDHNIHFRQRFESVVGAVKASQFMSTNYGEFVALGLVKLIASMLASKKFKLIDSNAMWLIRDERPPVENLLHLAFHAEEHVVSGMRSLGRPVWQLEENVLKFLDGLKGIPTLTETIHKQAFDIKHSVEILELQKMTYEIDIPDPIALTTDPENQTSEDVTNGTPSN